MGKIISIEERRASRGTPSKSRNPPSAGAMVLIFTLAAVGMTGIAVALSADNWSDAGTLIMLISIVALIKIAAANLLFFAMLKADQQPDSRLAPSPAPAPPPAKRNPVPLSRRPLAVKHRPARQHRLRRQAAAGGSAAIPQSSGDFSRPD